MNKIVIIYHTDLDGYGVKVVGRIYANLKGYEENDILFIKADYYKNENDYKKLFIDDLIDEQIKGHESEIGEIILGDISVKSEETAEYLNELSKTKKVILRDHHDTATWMNKYEWAKVKEADDEGIARSGTYWTAKELLSDEYIEKHPNLKKFIYLTDKFDAWTWAKSNPKLKKFIYLTDKFDAWTWAKSNPKLDEAVDLALLFGAMNEEGFDSDIYPKLLLENEVDLFDERMKFYLKIKNVDLRRQTWASYYSMKRGIYTYKDGDKEIPLKVAVVSTENGSIIAEKLREIFAMKHEEYDFILNFGLNGGLALRCSENPKVPVNKILMQMGDGSGGGHICSAGGKLPKGRIERGLEVIFDNLNIEVKF